jgi:hypothetical protein
MKKLLTVTLAAVITLAPLLAGAQQPTVTPGGGLAIPGAASASSLTASGLTSGDCVQASTGGLLTSASSACGSGGGGGSAYFSYGGTITSPFIIEVYYISNVTASTQTVSQTFTPAFTANPLCQVSTLSGIFTTPSFIFTNISTTTYQIYNSNPTYTLSAEVECVGPGS